MISAPVELSDNFSDPSSISNISLYSTYNVHFDLTIDFESLSIVGCVDLFMASSNIEGNLESILLDIRHIDVSNVCIDGEEVAWNLEPNVVQSLGQILKIKPSKMSESFKVTVQYKTLPESSALQWLSTDMTADKNRPFLFSQCQAVHARSLFPCQDTPSIKHTYTATVHVPSGFTVLMSAKNAEAPEDFDQPHGLTTFFFEQKMPIPSYLVAIACGELKSKQIGTYSRVWSEPSMLEKAAHEFMEVDDILNAAISICGPYEWDIYDLLVLPPSFPYGGMENPCLTFITPTIVAGDRSLVNVIAHEIAHSWTGNLVSNATWEHFWLNEGHTTYLENLILEKLYGTDFRELRIELGYQSLLECLKELGESHPNTKLIPRLDGLDPDDVYSLIPYQKGSMLLLFLEQMHGKDKMLAWLRAYITEFRLKSITTQTWLGFLVKYFGQSVIDEVKWNEWLYAPGHPPWKPVFGRRLSSVCEEVADLICHYPLGSDPKTTSRVRSTFENFIPEQKHLTLQILCNLSPLIHDNLRIFNSIFDLCQSQSAQIRFRWSLMCLLSQYLPGLDGALEFLNSQGRMKYTRPLYKALAKWPGVKDQAISNFYAQRPMMHPTTAKYVAMDLGLTGSRS